MSEKRGRCLYCNFCGNSQAEVLKLVAGPDCFICNECVNAAYKSLADTRTREVHHSELATNVVPFMKSETFSS